MSLEKKTDDAMDSWDRLFSAESLRVDHKERRARAAALLSRRSFASKNKWEDEGWGVNQAKADQEALDTLSGALSVLDAAGAQEQGLSAINGWLKKAIETLDEESGLSGSVASLFKARERFNAVSKISPLKSALILGAPAAVRALLKAGADANKKERSGEWAAYSYYMGYFHESMAVEMTRALLDGGLNAKALDGRGNGFAHACAKMSRDQSLALFLSEGADALALNPQGESPLHLACDARGSDCVQALLNAGADASARDGNGLSPLDKSALWAKRMDMDSDWDPQEESDNLAAQEAVKRVAMLLNAGADPLSAGPGGSRSPLQEFRDSARSGRFMGKGERAMGEAMEAWAQAMEISRAMGSAQIKPSARSGRI